MKLEEYEELKKLKKDLDLGDSWEIGYCWFYSDNHKQLCVFKHSKICEDYPYHAITKDGNCGTFDCAEEVPYPKAPKYRPFKNYAEFVKHWPSEKRYRVYVKENDIIFSLHSYSSYLNFAEAFREKIILTEEQVINEDYENGIPFGVLEND